MKWAWRFLNTEIGDPSLLLQSSQGNSILFDAGHLSGLSDKQMMSISTVCLTHFHLDHCEGFVNWLRVRARSPHPGWTRIMGPAGTRERVMSLTQGFEWNLLDIDAFGFEVWEPCEGGYIQSLVRFASGVYLDFESYFESLPKGWSMVRLDHHGVEVVGFGFRGAPIWNFDSDLFVPGPWVQTLKESVERGDLERGIQTPQGLYSAGELSSQCLTEFQPSFAYLTDFVFSQQNAEAVEAWGEFHTVFCEASFPTEERARALRVGHLTAYQAALVACLLGAVRFEPFHMSPAFPQSATRKEALDCFGQQTDNIAETVMAELLKVKKNLPYV